MSHLMPIVFKAETLLFEKSRTAHSSLRLRIIHRFQSEKGKCESGEEVFVVLLLIGGRENYIPLPLAQRLLVDYLARHTFVGQSATQIAAGMRMPFYRYHAANSGVPMHRLISRSAIKEYVRRIRLTFSAVLTKRGIVHDPLALLASEKGEGNEALYRLRIPTEWIHQIDNSPPRVIKKVFHSPARLGAKQNS